MAEPLAEYHRAFSAGNLALITGASSADIAFLIVDVEEGVKEQTKKHIIKQ